MNHLGFILPTMSQAKHLPDVEVGVNRDRRIVGCYLLGLALSGRASHPFLRSPGCPPAANAR